MLSEQSSTTAPAEASLLLLKRAFVPVSGFLNMVTYVVTNERPKVTGILSLRAIYEKILCSTDIQITIMRTTSHI